MGLAADFPALAKRLPGSELRELIRPWLHDAVVDKHRRTLTLTIRKVREVGMVTLLNNGPGRDDQEHKIRLTVKRTIHLPPPGGRARKRMAS